MPPTGAHRKLNYWLPPMKDPSGPCPSQGWGLFHGIVLTLLGSSGSLLEQPPKPSAHPVRTTSAIQRIYCGNAGCGAAGVFGASGVAGAASSGFTLSSPV